MSEYLLTLKASILAARLSELGERIVMSYETPMDSLFIMRALNRSERLRQHSAALVGFSIGTVAAWWVMLAKYVVFGPSWTWRMEMFQSSAWCSVAILWFPFALVEVVRRFKVERLMFAAALLSTMAGYDGVVRLLTQRIGGGC